MPSPEPDNKNHTSGHKPQRRMGLTMLVIAWLIILAILLSLFDDWLQKEHNPNQSPDSQVIDGHREVILQANRQHHYVVDGLINQHQVVLLLDTGATDVVIPAQLAQKIGLQQGPPQAVYTANGRITVYRTEIDHLQIGNITLSNIIASINPAMSDGVVLLGMSALRQIEFTQRGDTLILRQ